MEKKKLILLLLSCAAITEAHAAYQGRVYIDSNQNGIYDKGEKVLKDVRVSDGLNVVKTNAEGVYTLPGHERERFIFITTPSGYRTDNRYYQRIEGTEQAYDFGLQPWKGRIKPDGNHKFIHISDTEIFNTENQEDWANNIRDYAANQDIAFIIHTGDICYENGLKNHIHLMNTSNMDCPMFYCVGNHDLVKGKYGEEVFENVYGPVYYSFDFGNVHYVVTPMAGGDYQPGYTKEDLYRWLKNDLAQVPAEKPVVVFNHDLLTYGNDFVFGINENEKVNLNEHNLKAWLYGHWHNHFVRRQGEVLTISTATLDKGGIDHSTSAFRVIDVDRKGDIRTTLRYTYINKSIEIASIANDASAMTADGKVPVSVNTYNAVAPAVRVTYSCTMDGKTVLPETQLTQNTDWNWSGMAKLPADCKGKRVFITAKALFNNGEIAVSRSSFLSQPEEIGGTPQLAWIRNVNANLYFSSPVVAGGKVYAASVDEDLKGEGAVFALDAKTGELQWKYPVRNSIKNTIAVDEGTVFAQDAEGYLYAIDAQTGRLKWDKKMNVAGLPVLVDGLTAANGIVYAGSGKAFGAYNGKTGEAIWLNKGWPQGEATTSTPLLANDVIVSGANWRGFYGNDAKTGELLWKLDKDGITDRGATPACVGNLLYVASRQSLFIIDSRRGKVIVRKELPFNVQVNSTPLVTDNLIILGTQTDGLVALDRETFEVKWKALTSPALVYTAPYSRHPVATIETSPLLVGGTVYFGASDGIIYGVDPQNGKTTWKHKTGAPLFSTFTTDGNMIFATDFGGNVYAFDATNK
ncbi:PQQ-binding-like beta-propeller repeat protein [uncultured Parabacteroides sp.]|uniref:outer membrane protein assembly factor BamB family protein n=1 Tax=uncultured Parabacteroides sp. TaxID=512312 RepID=UPI0025E54802|nr:PQQ-binding-like beta-propeller repeat protein [uncultured Parabacteroides sp.]